jgi:hypothetical protein
MAAPNNIKHLLIKTIKHYIITALF